MIEELHFDANEIMLSENIKNHDINEVHHSFQSFTSERFLLLQII
jgi:hypothetical protein